VHITQKSKKRDILPSRSPLFRARLSDRVERLLPKYEAHDIFCKALLLHAIAEKVVFKIKITFH
jgi:hypothetical protein